MFYASAYHHHLSARSVRLISFPLRMEVFICRGIYALISMGPEIIPLRLNQIGWRIGCNSTQEIIGCCREYRQGIAMLQSLSYYIAKVISIALHLLDNRRGSKHSIFGL